MALNLIETLKTSIYSPKNTKSMKIHFKFFNFFKNFQNPYFQNNKFKNTNVLR